MPMFNGELVNGEAGLRSQAAFYFSTATCLGSCCVIQADASWMMGMKGGIND